MSYARRRDLPHIGHGEHLCMLWHARRDVEFMIPLVQDAEYICKLCGRAAAKQDNLCDPHPIKSEKNRK